MFIVISPAKKLKEEGSLSAATSYNFKGVQFRPTTPSLQREHQVLLEQASRLSPAELRELMGISEKLAVLNYERYQQELSGSAKCYCAAFMFQGDTYRGLNIAALSAAELGYAKSNLRILSGFYGVLRPLDLIPPYRLEMGISLATARGRNLYEFWGDRVNKLLDQQMQEAGTDLLLNLASNEYANVVLRYALPQQIITPRFEDYKQGKYKVIGLFAKYARGLMARYIIQHKITRPAELAAFDLEGYEFAPAVSTELAPVFRRNSQIH